MNYFTFNINDFIKVKLTEHGKNVYEHSNDETIRKAMVDGKIIRYLLPPELKYDENGYTRFQFWQFMNIFGKEIWNGSEAILESNLILMDPNDVGQTILVEDEIKDVYFN